MSDNPFSVFARVVVVIAGLLALVLWVGKYQQDRSHRHTHSREYRAKLRIEQLVFGVNAYFREYGSIPSGSNAQIFRSLLGENTQRIHFIEVPPQEISESGEVLDPWGMPYRIDTSDSALPKVYSCGPNKRDENGADLSDDIVPWR